MNSSQSLDMSILLREVFLRERLPNGLSIQIGNTRLLKWQKVGGGNFIFNFRVEFPYEGNQGNVDTNLHTMNAKIKFQIEH